MDSFGYQLIAGVGFGLRDQATRFVDYRFRNYPDASVTTAQINFTDLDLQSHSLGVGVCFEFQALSSKESPVALVQGGAGGRTVTFV